MPLATERGMIVIRGILPSHEGNDQYIGQFRLWRAVSVSGAATVVPLKQAG